MIPEFYLGMSNLAWLRAPELAGVHVFISMNSFDKYKSWPDTDAEIGVDSGGFTELKTHGRWRTSAAVFAEKCKRLKSRYGKRILWFSPQDLMCEELVIKGGKSKDGVFVGTGLSEEEHQRLTVINFVELRALLGDDVIPVVQGGKKVTSYWRCLEMYRDAGIDLSQFPRVGVGSVCRRQSSNEATLIMQSIASEIGPRLHGYGFKKDGYKNCAQYLKSGDTFAWSFAGRKQPDESHEHIALSRIPGNKGKRGAADDCAQCLPFALDWRADFLRTLEGIAVHAASSRQLEFVGVA